MNGLMGGLPLPEGIGLGLEMGGGVPSIPGMGNFANWQDFAKAVSTGVTAGYGTDMATLTGGGALRRQSLEGTLIAILQSANDFELFNRLNKSQAGATVDEFTTVDDTGTYPGGAVD